MMESPSNPPPGSGHSPRAGITLKVTLLAWLVTVLTLAIFVTAMIPEERAELRESLRAKGETVSVSVQSLIAGAAVTEDYSQVVEHALQVLEADPAVEFIVVSRNDGYSVLMDRRRWRSETLAERWHPAERVASSEMEVVPVFAVRAFRYSRPLDYSGIPWGWIHVGLKLEAYDRGVSRLRERSAWLGVLCVLLSLGVSLVYARRLVGPALAMRQAVNRVAAGDFSARTRVKSRDELGQLGAAFNTMAANIEERSRMLESVAFAARQLLSARDWRQAISGVLERVGQAAGADRVHVFAYHRNTGGRLAFSSRYEYTAPGVESTTAVWQSVPVDLGWTAPLFEELRAGRGVSMQRSEMTPEVLARMPASVLTVVFLPIRVHGEPWGILPFTNCRQQRPWTEMELSAFQVVAEMLGAAIARQRAQQALVEANETLEERVARRTEELTEQVSAKQKALQELGETQQRLIELSRISGMAEVATGVLHNVGNVLNSVNVSATIVADRLRGLRVSNLSPAVGMLRDHSGELDRYLAEDPKGQRVLPYLDKLAVHLNAERDLLVEEVRQMTSHVGHIKEIVAMQQTYARTSGMVERLEVRALFEDALRIVQGSYTRHGIEVRREFEELPPVYADRHKVLQILLNLLRNAKDAVKAAGSGSRQVTIRLRRSGQERLCFEVADNGIGIEQEDLRRIFSHGFTTKKGGHGFGLHSGALAAGQMEGSLRAESGGRNCGATLILELPLVYHDAAAGAAQG
jgi:signal transduction histidine kinase